MAYKVIMPKAGMAMETGKIVRWLKSEGDTVEAGEALLEIETDKVNMEVEAMNSGVLLKIIGQEGENFPVVQTIGYIGEPGEIIPEDDIKGLGKAEKEEKEDKEPVPAAQGAQLKISGGRIPATPAAKRIAAQKGIDLKHVSPSGSYGQVKAADVEAVKNATKATPLAKAMAQDLGLALTSIPGSGFAGKVVKADIAQAVIQTQTGEDELIPHSAMRRVIAKRMLQSHSEIPPVTQSSVADVTVLEALRSKLKGDERVSVNDFIIMAVARTLKEQLRINASYTEEGLLIKKHVNIGMAVALPEGLIVPVIRDADQMTLRQISQKSKELAAKAREGRLMPDDYSGGTFTVSNLGMMGVTSFTPIINQPEIAILGVCAIEQRLEMEDGRITKRLKMGLSLTYDHRCIDGAQAAVFSNRVAELLENPLMLLV